MWWANPRESKAAVFIGDKGIGIAKKGSEDKPIWVADWAAINTYPKAPFLSDLESIFTDSGLSERKLIQRIVFVADREKCIPERSQNDETDVYADRFSNTSGDFLGGKPRDVLKTEGHIECTVELSAESDSIDLSEQRSLESEILVRRASEYYAKASTFTGFLSIFVGDPWTREARRLMNEAMKIDSRINEASAAGK